VQQRHRITRPTIIDSNADTDADSQRMIPDHDWMAQRMLNTLRNTPDILYRSWHVDHHGKFIAAETGHRIARSGDVLQSSRNSDQQLIANGVPQTIVDLFETIQIDQQDAAW
jgi:hypothetical protein